MEINKADVAELVDARDLKSSGATETPNLSCKTAASAPAEKAANPAGLQNALRFKIKVPQTLDQAAKLRTWLESQRHKTPRPAQNFLSNIVAQCKGIRDEHDLKRVQPHIAWQAERLAR